MRMEEKKYLPRLIDEKINDYLSVFGAISIDGPKWCGKTWTSSKHSKTETYMDEKDIREMALIDPKAIFESDLNKRPQLIDEWHLVPEIWDAVRRECDKSPIRGNFILTGSTTLPKEKESQKIKHSGTGRICSINMYPMSLYESGDSTGKASIMAMYNNTQENINNDNIEIIDLARLIIRGGWPDNINTAKDKIGLIPKAYIKNVLEKDIDDEDGKQRDINKMRMLLRSLARNESSIVNNKTLLKDIEEYEKGEELLSSRDTVLDYLDLLDRLHLIENQDAYSENYRSPDRVGKSSKRHFTDPSLACACLDLNVDKLMKDLNTFGFMFESLVERDLRIYMDYLDGKLYHFRDNVTGLEVDSILEFSDGEYAAVEIKLGFNSVKEAINNLVNFKKQMIKEPKFMCVIVGKCNVILRDVQTGIYVVPITALRP